MDQDKLTRPKATDTEDDLVKMQEEYFRMKSEGNSDLQPAASAIRVGSSGQKQSVYAKRRNIKQSESDKRMKPNEVIGEVVERKYDEVSRTMKTDNKAEESDDDDKGFPKPQPIDARSVEGSKGNSVFSQMLHKKQKSPEMPIKIVESSPASRPVDQTQGDLHEENLRTISQMTQEEIVDAQETLKRTIDPNLLNFIKTKRKSNEQANVAKPQPAALPTHDLHPQNYELLYPETDFLRKSEAKQWLHFDVIEPEKLEWTRDFERNVAKPNPGETYEARFDFFGMLQPYTLEMTEANRHLFMHGGDQSRPGLTLQDFFRLARSENLQQRVASINAIAGIIKIFNTGHYDGIIELPIAKLFFLLRFAMDENIPAIIETSSRALSYLFYNESDEILLDATYETKNGLIQPIIGNKQASVVATSADETDTGLEGMMRNLNLNDKKLFETDFADEVETDDSDRITDFHLAETNLVECLARSNILRRIYYILAHRNKPSDVTLVACIKILIRLARTGREHALNILNTEDLIATIQERFLPTMEAYKAPHTIVIKLFRVLASYDRNYLRMLMGLGIVDRVQGYLESTREIDLNLLRVQIESLRFMRLYFYSITDEKRFKSLVVSINYYLNFHYNRTEFQTDSYFIYRQHASAVVQLLACCNFVVIYPLVDENFTKCLCKWVEMARRHGLHDYTQRLLLSTMFDIAAHFVKFSKDSFFDFVERFFKPFLRTKQMEEMIDRLKDTSPILDQTSDRCNIHKPLLNLGSVARKSATAPPTQILHRDYAIHMFNSIGCFISAFGIDSNEAMHDILKQTSAIFYPKFEPYMIQFGKSFNQRICTNWFMKAEINFIYHLILVPYLAFNGCIIYVAMNLVSILTHEKTIKIFDIFDRFVFRACYYYGCNIGQPEFEEYKLIFRGVVEGKLAERKYVNVAAVENWNQIMLGTAWPYSLLLFLLYKEEANINAGGEARIVETDLTELDIIQTSLKFTSLLEKHKLCLITKNQQLMYLMLYYFGNDNHYLSNDVRNQILDKVKALQGVLFRPRFNFKLNGEKSFESLYTMFLNIFKSQGYNDPLFGLLVMVPLMQKYDVKWRKLVWSEHQDAVRCIRVRSTQLLYGLSDYLTPAETDVSLLRNYASALASDNVIKDSVPYKIATHHLTEARKAKIINF